jgi:hypothetical protein
MKLIYSLTLASAACASTSFAGEPTYAAPAPAPPIIEVADDSLGFTVALGYDSQYIFRGVDFGDNLVWGNIDYANDFGSPVELNLGAWYAATNGNDGDEFDELDLYAGISASAGPVDFGTGAIYYYFPDDDSYTFEVYGSVGTEFAGVGLELYVGHDFELNDGGTYAAITAGYSVPLGDTMSLDFSTGVSYGDDYSVAGADGFNNVDLRLALPIALTDTATLEPYIAGSIAIDSLSDAGEDDYLYGGVSISVTF